MDELKYLSLATTYEIDKTFDSERFIKMRLKICHDGVNPNGSNFNVSDIKNAEVSIANTPILANTLVDEENQTVDLGSHDMHLEKHKLKDGEYKLIYDELVVGVVPETNNYEIFEEDCKNYAFADCFIFREYSNYFEDFIEENQESKLSMEIYVDKGEFNKATNTFDILEFRYKGITFLGKKYGTGMIGAKAEMSNFEQKRGLFTLLSDLKLEIEKYQSSLKRVDIDTLVKKEEDFKLNEKQKLLEQYNIQADTLDFNLDDISIDDLKIKLEAFKAKADDTSEKNKFALNGQFMDELIEKLSVEKIEAEWGSYSKYSFVDYDADTGEVYCFDRADWKLYGFTYSISGDSVTVDFACKKRKKFSIVDFIESTDKDVTFAGAVNDVAEAIVLSKDKAFEALKLEFDEYKIGYSTANTEVTELIAFKDGRLQEDYKVNIDAALAEFADLNEIDEFVALTKDAYSFESVDALKEKCYAIRGKNTSVKFEAKPNKNTNIKLPIGTHSNDNDEPYGGLFSEFSKQK